MKRVVVDRQSATITILLNGSVVRVLPFRIISDDTIVVGDRLFSGPLPDLHKWEEQQSRHDRSMNGWNMRPGDKPTFVGTLPVKPLCFRMPGPREQYEIKKEYLRDRMGKEHDEDELSEILDELDVLKKREDLRRKNAKRQSRRKRPQKVDRKKSKHGPSESGSSGSGKKKSKKKGKTKDNAGIQGEKSGNRKGRQKK